MLDVSTFSEHPTSNVLDTSDPHTWSVGGGADYRAVLLTYTTHGTDVDKVNGVTYGGVAMTRVRSDSTSAGDEDGRSYIYFLANPPTGTQDVVVDKVDTTGSWGILYCIDTLLPDTSPYAGIVEVVDHDGDITGGTGIITMTNPSRKAVYPFGVVYNAAAAVPAIWTYPDTLAHMLNIFNGENIDPGNQTSASFGGASQHSATVKVGYGISDDWAISAVLLGETENVQVAVPDSTIQGARTLGGAATRHEALSDGGNESYITSSNATDDVLTLSNLVDPVVHTGHVIFIAGTGTSGTGTGTIELWQGSPLGGGSLIKAQSGMPGVEWVTETVISISEAEAANITNYNDLYVLYNKSGGTASKIINDIVFQVPALDTSIGTAADSPTDFTKFPRPPRGSRKRR